MEGVSTAKIGSVILDCKSAYVHSFGPLKNETRYTDPWNKVDYRPELEKKMSIGIKALTSTTGGAGTAGFALVPIYVDPRIVDVTRKFTPLVELIPRVTNQGLTADYNQITAKGGGFTAAEDGAMAERNDTYVRKSTAIKFLYAVGRITGQMQAAMPSFILEGFQPTGSGLGGGEPFSPAGVPNAKQLEVIMKAREMRELEENLIVNGDITSDTTQFSGIVKLQGSENVVDLNDAALTWDDIETAVRYAFDDGGRPKIAIASSAVVQDIRKIIVDTFRYNPSDMGGTLPFGVSASIVLQTMVGPIPVIPSMYLSNTSGAKQIYFLDTDYIEMRVLQDMTYEDLAKTNDSQKFMLKIYECLIMRNIKFNSFVDAIT
ncbi:MAG: DUF5309 family protein [Nitrosopumilus sp.]